MAELLTKREYARTYKYDMLLTSNGTYEDHLAKIQQSHEKTTRKNPGTEPVTYASAFSKNANSRTKATGLHVKESNHNQRKWKRSSV